MLLLVSMQVSEDSNRGGQNSELSPWKLCQESAVRLYLSQDNKSMLSKLMCLRKSATV